MAICISFEANIHIYIGIYSNIIHIVNTYSCDDISIYIITLCVSIYRLYINSYDELYMAVLVCFVVINLVRINLG